MYHTKEVIKQKIRHKDGHFVWRRERDSGLRPFPLRHAPSQLLRVASLHRTLRSLRSFLRVQILFFIKKINSHIFRYDYLSPGGERGIRTLGTVAGSLVFETSQFNHSCTSPRRPVRSRLVLPSRQKL